MTWIFCFSDQHLSGSVIIPTMALAILFYIKEIPPRNQVHKSFPPDTLKENKPHCPGVENWIWWLIFLSSSWYFLHGVVPVFTSAFHTTFVHCVCAWKTWVSQTGFQPVPWEGFAGAHTIPTSHSQETSQDVSLHVSMLRCNIVGNREQMFYSVGLMFSSVELFLVKVSFMIVAFCTTQLQESEQTLEMWQQYIFYVKSLVQLNVQ